MTNLLMFTLHGSVPRRGVRGVSPEPFGMRVRRGVPFDHEAPVKLRAGMVLKDGTTIRLEFSDEWPEDCFLVYLDPPGKEPEPLTAERQATASQTEMPYEANALLARVVNDPVAQHLDPAIRGLWLWPRL